MAQHLEKYEQCPWCGEGAGWSYDYQTCGNCDYPVGRPPYVVNPLSAAFDHVIAERRRQVEVEGWTSEHDDQHENGALSGAGAAYALNAACMLYGPNGTPIEEPENYGWMFEREWWKPKTPRQDLVRAAALIIAEIERLDRAAGGERT